MSNSIQDVIAQIEEAKIKLRESISEDGQAFIDQLLRPLFGVGAAAVRWRQYTPYFNDGEPCEFSVYGPEISHPDLPSDAGDYGDGFVDGWAISYAFGRGQDDASNYYASIREALSGIDAEKVVETFKDVERTLHQESVQEVLKVLYDDHTQVTVYASRKTPVVVEEYDHS